MKLENLILSIFTFATAFTGVMMLGQSSANAIDINIPGINLPVISDDLANKIGNKGGQTANDKVNVACEDILNRVPAVDTPACSEKRSQCVQSLRSDAAAREEAGISQCLSQTEPEPNCATSLLGNGPLTPDLQQTIDQNCPRVPVNLTTCLRDLTQRILDQASARFESNLRDACPVPPPQDNPGVGQEPPTAGDPGQVNPGNAGNADNTPQGAQLVEGEVKGNHGTGGCSLNAVGGGISNLWSLAMAALPALVAGLRKRTR